MTPKEVEEQINKTLATIEREREREIISRDTAYLTAKKPWNK